MHRTVVWAPSAAGVKVNTTLRPCLILRAVFSRLRRITEPTRTLSSSASGMPRACTSGYRNVIIWCSTLIGSPGSVSFHLRGMRLLSQGGILPRGMWRSDSVVFTCSIGRQSHVFLRDSDHRCYADVLIMTSEKSDASFRVEGGDIVYPRHRQLSDLQNSPRTSYPC